MIDWTQPIETTETPPRPVRVLATDIDGSQFPIVAAILGLGDTRLGRCANDGEHILLTSDGMAVRLRNVAPPKPEPIMHEGWVRLYAKAGQWPSASHNVYSSEDEAREAQAKGIAEEAREGDHWRREEYQQRKRAAEAEAAHSATMADLISAKDRIAELEEYERHYFMQRDRAEKAEAALAAARAALERARDEMEASGGWEAKND